MRLVFHVGKRRGHSRKSCLWRIDAAKVVKKIYSDCYFLNKYRHTHTFIAKNVTSTFHSAPSFLRQGGRTLDDLQAHTAVVVGALPETGVVFVEVHAAVGTHTPVPLTVLVINEVHFDVFP